MDEIINQTKTKLESSIIFFKNKLSKIIATGAHPSLLNGIQVKYYDNMTPINQIANIKAPDATMLIVTPFEKNITKDIIEAINKEDLGINPVDEGHSIRIMIPAITLEKRELFAKEAKVLGEEAKISIRNVRTEMMKKMKLKETSENEEILFNEEIQKLVDNSNKEVLEIVNKKIESLTHI